MLHLRKKFAEAEITSQTQNNSLTFALQKQNMKCFELEKQMEMKQNEIEVNVFFILFRFIFDF